MQLFVRRSRDIDSRFVHCAFFQRLVARRASLLRPPTRLARRVRSGPIGRDRRPRAALRISSRAIFLASMSSTLVGEGAAELSSRKKSRGTSPVAATKARRDARRDAHPALAHFGEHCASPQDAQTTRSGPETGRRVAARRAGPRALELRRVVTRRGHGRESRGSDAARPRETAKTTRVESVCAEKWYPSSREGAAVGCGAGCSYLEDAVTGERMNVLRETDMVSGEVDEVHACACARRNASLPYESTSAAT